MVKGVGWTGFFPFLGVFVDDGLDPFQVYAPYWPFRMPCHRPPVYGMPNRTYGPIVSLAYTRRPLPFVAPRASKRILDRVRIEDPDRAMVSV